MSSWAEMSLEQRRKAVEGAIVKGTVLRDEIPGAGVEGEPLGEFYAAYKRREMPNGPYIPLEELYSVSIGIAQLPLEISAKKSIKYFVAKNGDTKARYN